MNNPGRELLLSHVSERQWRQQVLDWAKQGGWLRYFTFDPRHSIPGFPDLVLCRPPHIIFAELKRADGKLTALQQEWITALSECGSGEVHACVWHPADEVEVRAVLLGGRW